MRLKELRLDRRLIELVKAPQKIRETTVVECLRSLRGCLRRHESRFVYPSRSFGTTSNLSNNNRPCLNATSSHGKPESLDSTFSSFYIMHPVGNGGSHIHTKQHPLLYAPLDYATSDVITTLPDATPTSCAPPKERVIKHVRGLDSRGGY